MSCSQTLPDEIARIIADRGPFRNIKEENIKGDSKTPQNPPTIRHDILQLIENAHNEASLALETTSLLLSSTRTGAETALSPVLRQRIPTGSLGAARIRASEPPIDNTIPKAWKDQAIRDSSAVLQQASESASLALESEATLWRELVQLLKSRWTISRAMRLQQSNFIEIPLKENPEQEFLQVSLLSGDTLIAHSTYTPRSSPLDKIQDIMYEKDLFRELSQEASTMFHLGVEVSGNSITVPAGESVLLIQLSQTSPDAVSNEDANNTCQAILLFLHLVYFNFLNQGQTLKPTFLNRDPLLGLQTITTWVNFQNESKRLLKELETRQTLLHQHSINLSIKRELSFQIRGDSQSVLVQDLMKPLEREFEVELPGGSRVIIKMCLSDILHYTVRVTARQQCKPTQHFNIVQVLQQVDWATTLDLVFCIRDCVADAEWQCRGDSILFKKAGQTYHCKVIYDPHKTVRILCHNRGEKLKQESIAEFMTRI